MDRSPVVLIMVGVVRPQQPARMRPAAHRFALAPDTVTAAGAVCPSAGSPAAMLSPRWQPFQKMLSVAGSVAVITSVVLGGDAGVIVYGVSRLLYVAIAVGVAAGALALGWATWYQWRHWCQASRPPSREVTPGLAARADERPLRRAGSQEGDGRDAAI